MFKKNKELRLLAIGALILAVFGVISSIVAMSTALSIKEANQFWKVDVTEVDIDVNGNAKAEGVEVNSTSLNNIGIYFTGPGEVTYNFKVRNSGAVDAILKSINMGRPLCGLSCDCHGVSFKLTYEDGREVITGDMINFETNMKMKLVVSYTGNTSIMVKDLDLILLYEQA